MADVRNLQVLVDIAARITEHPVRGGYVTGTTMVAVRTDDIVSVVRPTGIRVSIPLVITAHVTVQTTVVGGCDGDCFARVVALQV